MNSNYKHLLAGLSPKEKRTFAEIIGIFRASIRSITTRRRRVSMIEKTLRAAVFVPIFVCLLVLLGLRGRLLGRIRLETSTAEGDRFACYLPEVVPMFLYLFGVWEPDIAAFIGRRLREGDVFVDVGANVGFYSLLASRKVGVGGAAGRVVAIEAAPAVFDRLRETLQLNGQPTNIRPVNQAAAEHVGMLNIYAALSPDGGDTTTVQRGRRPLVASVAAAPLDELLLEDEISRVRLIKIDVEGGEDAVLNGLLGCIDRLPHEVEIAVELTPQWWAAHDDRTKTAADVLQPFIERGFHVFTISNNYWPWRYLWPRDVQPPRRLRDEQLLLPGFREGNLLAPQVDVVLSRQDTEEL